MIAAAAADWTRLPPRHRGTDFICWLLAGSARQNKSQCIQNQAHEAVQRVYAMRVKLQGQSSRLHRQRTGVHDAMMAKVDEEIGVEAHCHGC